MPTRGSHEKKREKDVRGLLDSEHQNVQVVGFLAYDASRDRYLLLPGEPLRMPLGRCRRHEGQLSLRELQVLQLVSAGFSNEEVARKLNISLNTAKRHLQSIFLRLNVASRSEAVARAIWEGWLRFA